MRIAVVLLVLSLVVATVPAGAQQQPADVDAWRALAGALAPGSFVSVRTKDGKRLRGTFVQQTDDGILVKPKTRLASPMRSIAYTEIDELERAKAGMSPGAKVLLGVGIGAAVFLLVGVLVVAAAGY
jgi:hypothetical protein